MKKNICTLAGIMLTTTLMMGCGVNTASTQDKQTTQTAESTQSASTDDASTKQKDFVKADLEGEVTSISGNKITLKVIKTPEMPEGGAQANQGSDADKTSASKDSDKTKPADVNKDGTAPKSPENMKVEYTGETKDITADDGIQIKTMNMGKEEPESKDITVNDIKVGDVLQITYSDKEKETISTINVRSAASQK